MAGTQTPELVDVAVPVAIDRSFTYAWPSSLEGNPAPGTRVVVPFGPRALIGVVRPGGSPAPLEGQIREVLYVLDEPGQPALVPEVVRLVEWLSDYYAAPVGEVYRLALPRLSSGADVRTAALTERGTAWLDAALSPLAEDMAQLLVALRGLGGRSVPLPKLRAKWRGTGFSAALRSLEAEGAISLALPDAEETAARTEVYVRRTDRLRGTDANEERLRGVLGRSKERRALLDHLEGLSTADGASLSELRGPFPRVREHLDRLVEAGLVILEDRPRALDPFAAHDLPLEAPKTLTDEQSAVLAALAEPLSERTFRTALLQGITGSGKTEIYLRLCAVVRASGGGAIVLVPEIALTPQLAGRFRVRFGEEVVVLHSGLTPRQRLDAWHSIRRGERSIVVGARSAIFAPVSDLRLIVVDEEHDASFKQEEGVRYHGRDVAVVRGRLASALVVLGSATPSLETYEHARGGHYAWQRLRHRPTPRPLPEVECISLGQHRPDPASLLTARLRDAVRATVAAGEQAILFLNRRGYSAALLCEACGHKQSCPDCSAASMTYHLDRNRLLCHLCGHIESPVDRCEVCGAQMIATGVGTERVELEIQRALPDVRVLRLDRDAARGRELPRTLDRFRRHEADVLVGTQMLSKGHDFPGVTLVGVLQADHGLSLPDPRAAERVFQLLTQVAGRAGRGDRPGRVIFQAYAVDHFAVTHAARHDFDGFADLELALRAELGNPPFGHLVLVRASGPTESVVRSKIRAVASDLRAYIAAARAKRGLPSATAMEALEVLGPVESPIGRINGQARWQILLRARTRPPLRALIHHLRPELGTVGSGAGRVTIIADVDPVSML